MNNKIFLASIRYKKFMNLEDITSLFLVRGDTTKEQLVNFLKEYSDESLDLRTMRWEEFDITNKLMELKKNIVPIESQLGDVTLK